MVHHQPQRFPVQGGRADAPARRCDGRGQGQVSGSRREFGQARVPGTLAEVECGLRMAAAEDADQQRQRRLAKGVLERHGDPAAHHLGFVPHQVQPGPELVEGRVDVGQQRLGRRSQPDSPAVADQQVSAHHGAGAGERPADRGLGYAQQFRCFRYVLRPPELGQDGKQGQQLHQLFVLDVHLRPPDRLIRYRHLFYVNHALEACLPAIYAGFMPLLSTHTPPKPEPWDGHPKGSAAYGRLLAGLAFAGVATFAQLYSTQAVLPIMATDLQITAAEAALTISLATVGLAVTVIPWSFLADRIGRVRAMTLGILAATVLGLLAPLAATFPILLGLRLLEGMALGGIPAIAIAYLNEEVHKAHAALAAGTYVAGTTLGGLAGRLVAGPVGELWGWRAATLAVSLLAAVAAVLFLLLVPKARGFTPARAKGFRGGARTLAGHLRNPRLLALYVQAFLLMGGFVAVYNYLGFRLSGEPFGLPATLISLIFVAYLSGTVTSRLAAGLTHEVRAADHPAGRHCADGPGPRTDPDAVAGADPGRAAGLHRAASLRRTASGPAGPEESPRRAGRRPPHCTTSPTTSAPASSVGPAAWSSSRSAGRRLPWRSSGWDVRRR